MKLAYQAIDSAGALVSDVLDAGSIEEAADALRARGLFVTELAPESSASGKKKAQPAGPRRRGGKTKRLRQVAMFSRQLQVLVATGTPLADAVAALGRQTKDPAFYEVVVALQRSVEEGAPLSEALARYPEYFDQVYCNIILAGESSGSLDTMLDRLAGLCRKQAQLRTQLTGAMVYPALLISISIAVIVVMLTLVMPRFTGLFETLDVPLPATTKLLMLGSDFLLAYWWAVLAALVAGTIAAARWARTPAGKAQIDKTMVRLPKVSQLTRSLATAKIARLIGVLVGCNIPLLEALQLARHAAGNSVYTQLMRDAEQTVLRGEAASSAFTDDRLIDSAFYEAMRNGEQSGQVGPVLLTVADFLEEDNEVRLKSATSLIEPVILIVLGIVVGGIAVSMFLPLFDLTASAGGGAP